MRRTLSPHRTRLIWTAAGGFTVTELMVVLGLIGLLVATGVPYFITYWQSSKLRAGAEQLASVINEARQLAIKLNGAVCVQRQAGNTVRFVRSAACTGSNIYIGPGTDAAGDIRLSEGVEVSAVAGGVNVVFNYLGAATPASTYTVRNPTNGVTLEVRVAQSGRVQICSQPSPAC